MYLKNTKNKREKITTIKIDPYFYLNLIMDYEKKEKLVCINIDFEESNGLNGVNRTLSLRTLYKALNTAKKEFTKHNFEGDTNW